MNLDSVRKLLYSSKSPVTMVAGDLDNFIMSEDQISQFFQAISSPTLRLSREDQSILDGVSPIRSANDVLSWIEVRIRSQLLSLKTRDDCLWQIMSLLRGALSECLLAEHFQNETVFHVLVNQYEYFRPSLPIEVRNDLDIAYKTKDVRRIILFLSRLCFGRDGRELLGKLGLKFPEASMEVTPELIRQHQSGSRPTQYWFYNSLEGRSLFLVFYTQKCAFAQCAGCNLHLLGDDRPIKATSVIEQINQVFDDDLQETERSEIREVVLSNNGSVFDTKTFSLPALLYFCARAPISFPKLKKLVIETRVEYVTSEAIELIKNALSESGREIQIELAIGVEVFDEEKRNKEFHKGLSNRALNEFLELSGKMGVSVRCYFMYKPLPGMSTEESNSDIVNAVSGLNELSEKHHASITMHLNPTYVAVETSLEKAFREGGYLPPSLEDVRDLLLSLPKSKIDIYIGLNDEGLAVEGGSFLENSSEDVLSQLRNFNRTQELSSLKARGIEVG